MGPLTFGIPHHPPSGSHRRGLPITWPRRFRPCKVRYPLFSASRPILPSKSGKLWWTTASTRSPSVLTSWNCQCFAPSKRRGSRLSTDSRPFWNAREIKTVDEIELLKLAAAMVDATYVDIARAIRPGTRENELVAIANDRLFRLGSERVECVNSVWGQRGRPHSHTFSDRIIQPGDMVFLDIMHSFNGYRTCYYRTFICGEPNKHQIDAYETASKWISASIDMIRPGVTPDQVAQVWPDAQEFGYRDEAEAFLLQYGHGVGLSLWERPIISKRYTGQNTPLKEGMVFALETWKGAEDGSGAARIEEEVVVTKDGCQIITNFPSDRLISCGLPGCEVF